MSPAESARSSAIDSYPATNVPRGVTQIFVDSTLPREDPMHPSPSRPLSKLKSKSRSDRLKRTSVESNSIKPSRRSRDYSNNSRPLMDPLSYPEDPITQLLT